jgi:hypothetical protein
MMPVARHPGGAPAISQKMTIQQNRGMRARLLTGYL